MNADSSSDDDPKRPLSPGPPPPPLRGIPHIKGPPNPASRTPTPLTSPTHAPNLSDIISALRSGEGIDLSNISTPLTGPNSDGVNKRLEEPSLAAPQKTAAWNSSNESLGSMEKRDTSSKRKLKRKKLHQSSAKQVVTQPAVEVRPPVVPSSCSQQDHPKQDRRKNNILNSNANQNGTYSTSSISSDSAADMESRDKFDPGRGIDYNYRLTLSILFHYCYFSLLVLFIQCSPLNRFSAPEKTSFATSQ